MHLSDSEIAGRALRVGIGEGRTGELKDSLRATLGSCVGICLLWSRAKRFALAHILLPDSSAAKTKRLSPCRYADTAVPWLLESLGVGPRKRREVTALIAGGASLFTEDQLTQVGAENVEAARKALRSARIRITGEDVGGEESRQIVVDGPSRFVLSLRLEQDEAVRWEMPALFRDGDIRLPDGDTR